MRLIVLILLLTSCQSREVAGDQNATTIATQAGLIDGEANTIEAKFPKAKPHTDKIKESTPIIRDASNELQQIIQEQEKTIKDLKEKNDNLFKWIFCGGLALFGGIGIYFGTNGGGSIRTILGASLLASAPCAYRYYDFIADYLVPIFAVAAIITYALMQRDKDIERVENIKKMK